jgi:hypothetical protein
MLLALLAMWGSMNLIRGLMEALMSDASRPASHNDYSGRLQVLQLTGDAFVLVFDRWSGPSPSQGQRDTIKKETGARGVLFFDGEIEIDC